MGSYVELSDSLSDNSSFYGDDDRQRELEDRINALDVEAYWEWHSRDINVRAFSALKSGRAVKNETDIATIKKVDEKVEGDVTPPRFMREPFNPREGEIDSKQLGETVDEFISRLPVIGSSQVGPWLWASNPYAERGAEPETKDYSFLQRAKRLMQEYLELKATIAASEPGIAPGTITRRLKADREKLKEDILDMAKNNGLICGKWMLFPSQASAEKIWREVVHAVVNNKLGTACKIATDGDTRLICCYTKNFADLDDVRRVVQALADLGLTPTDSSRSLYYKCDAFTHLDIGSGNEYGIAASLYSSKDILKSPLEHESKTVQKQKRTLDSFVKSRQPAGKRTKLG